MGHAAHLSPRLSCAARSPSAPGAPLLEVALSALRPSSRSEAKIGPGITNALAMQTLPMPRPMSVVRLVACAVVPSSAEFGAFAPRTREAGSAPTWNAKQLPPAWISTGALLVTTCSTRWVFRVRHTAAVTGGR